MGVQSGTEEGGKKKKQFLSGISEMSIKAS